MNAIEFSVPTRPARPSSQRKVAFPLWRTTIALRMLAATEWQVKGAWTQDLLWEMRSSKVLTDEQYRVRSSS